jgi:FixJ family two-component response regulator
MPGMSGLDLQHHLRAAGNPVPVILMTAFPQDHMRRRAQDCDAMGFFTKPFESRALIDCIERALRSRK